MKKYFTRYVIFWAPAFIIACFFNNSTEVSRVSQLAFAGFMLLGWCVNTAIASYYYPRTALSGLLIYLGVNLLLTVAGYSINTGRAFSPALMKILGFASFTPLDIAVTYLLEYNIPQEIFIICFIFFLLMVSWAAGAVYARLNPNPYSPKITGKH